MIVQWTIGCAPGGRHAPRGLLRVSALAVSLLGPTVKAAGFTTLLLVMAGISSLTTFFVSMLPGRVPSTAPAAAPAPAR
jgi:hypothetical protein